MALKQIVANNLPTKCPGCESAVEMSERWSDDEPEWTRFECGSAIDGFSDSVEIVSECSPKQPARMSDDAYEALANRQSDNLRKWAFLETRRRELGMSPNPMQRG